MENSNSNIDFGYKWSAELVEYGFTQIPNSLIRCQGHLDLKDGELVTLLQLMTFWFTSARKVYPSIATLSQYSGNGRSTIQRRLMYLEQKGFIARSRRFLKTNMYDLSPSAKLLQKHLVECPYPKNRKVKPSPQKPGNEISITRVAYPSKASTKQYLGSPTQNSLTRQELPSDMEIVRQMSERIRRGEL